MSETAVGHETGGAGGTKAGFVGLGNIGGPMAARVAQRLPTHVYDLDADAVARLREAGATPAADCAAVAAAADVIGVCVVDDASTRAVVAGERGLLEAARPGAVIVVHGTIHPETARDLAARAARAGVSLLDAQVTGGAGGAAQGTLTTMVGGEAAALEKARPYLDCFSKQVTHCGPVGSGAIAKLCNNLVQFQTWQALAEASRLAEGAGIEQDTLWEVLSWMLNDNSRAMLASRAVLRGDPDHEVLRPAFEAARALAHKDLDLALRVGREAGVDMPATALCSQRMSFVLGLREPR